MFDLCSTNAPHSVLQRFGEVIEEVEQLENENTEWRKLINSIFKDTNYDLDKDRKRPS